MNGWRLKSAVLSRGVLVVCMSTILLSSCMAAPFLVPVAFEFARNLFQTGLSNYGSKHRDNLSNLVNRLSGPYTQGLPQTAFGGPGIPGQPGQPGFQGQPGQPAFQGQVGMAPQQFPGQQAYPGQQTYPGQSGAGIDPNNPYGNVASAYPGATTIPGAVTSPYGAAPQGYPPQAGMAPSYDPNNPYGTGATTPYGQPTNPYGAPAQYGQQANPYGTPSQYGQPASPYGAPSQYGQQTNPYGTAGPNPYGAPNQYGQTASPYGTAAPQNPYQAQPGYDPNNPYGTAGSTQGYGQAQQGYGQPPTYGQAQSGYGTPSPYGTQPAQQQAVGGAGQAYGAQSYGGQQSYGSAGVYPRSVGSEPVSVDVAMIRQKQTAKGKEVVLMNDGEVLKDGGANKDAGDKFKIVVRTNCDCYLYIMSIDGSGWAEPIYPSKDSAPVNPVKKDQEYAFPEGAYWYSLDQIKGIESFFVVASPNRRTDLEESFAQMAAEPRPTTPIVAKVEEPPVIPRGVGSVHTRGIIKVKDESGETTQMTPLSYAASQPGQDVTVTRWFKHE